MGSLREHKLWSYLQLMRPPNMVTAAADIMAGYAAAGRPDGHALPWLLIATTSLYAGGVVLNDVFDAKLDAVERPERPIPGQRVTKSEAQLLGITLLGIGIVTAFQASLASSVMACLIASCAVLYNAWGKHQSIIGPINMGLCRGLNLMLGVSAAASMLFERWYLMLIPVAYIAAVTAISRGEVRGGQRRTGLLALSLLGAVIMALLILTRTKGFELVALLPFLAIFSWRVGPPFWRAYLEPRAEYLRTAVKAGVLSLIILDAALAAGYAGPLYGTLVISLFFISTRLARLFAVT